MFDNYFFFSCAVMTLIGAASVVWVKNIIHAALFLLLCLFGVSGLYATLGADFLAATQLVVYAGGVIIIMLFSVMITGGNGHTKNRFGLNKIDGMGSNKTLIIGSMITFTILLVVIKMLANMFKYYEQGELPPYSVTTQRIGTLLITDHVLSFEISSVLLLGALIGAAVIARPRKS